MRELTGIRLRALAVMLVALAVVVTGCAAEQPPTGEDQYLREVATRSDLDRIGGDEQLLILGHGICSQPIGTARAELIDDMSAFRQISEPAADAVISAAEQRLCPRREWASAAPARSSVTTTVAAPTIRATPAAAPTSRPAAAPSSSITYEVTGDGVGRANSITYVKDASFGQQQANGVALPWSTTVQIESSSLGRYSSVLAQSGSGGNGSITCRILDSTGREITSSTSSGPYAVVTCSSS